MSDTPTVRSRVVAFPLLVSAEYRLGQRSLLRSLLMAAWWTQRPVIVDGRCTICGGKPFHKMDCPLLLTAMGIALALLVGFVIVSRISPNVEPGLPAYVVAAVVLVLLIGGLVRRALRRHSRP